MGFFSSRGEEEGVADDEEEDQQEEDPVPEFQRVQRVQRLVFGKEERQRHAEVPGGRIDQQVVLAAGLHGGRVVRKRGPVRLERGEQERAQFRVGDVVDGEPLGRLLEDHDGIGSAVQLADVLLDGGAGQEDLDHEQRGLGSFVVGRKGGQQEQVPLRIQDLRGLRQAQRAERGHLAVRQVAESSIGVFGVVEDAVHGGDQDGDVVDVPAAVLHGREPLLHPEDRPGLLEIVHDAGLVGDLVQVLVLHQVGLDLDDPLDVGLEVLQVVVRLRHHRGGDRAGHLVPAPLEDPDAENEDRDDEQKKGDDESCEDRMFPVDSRILHVDLGSLGRAGPEGGPHVGL